MSGSIPEVTVTVKGVIKWFDSVKGFGFLADSAGSADVLLHANVLRNFGQGSVVEGARVELRAIHTPRGRQAVEILSILPPDQENAAPIPDLSQVAGDRLALLPLLPARVKWFDKGKGFGFATIFGQKGDVFLHVQVLRYCGFADLIPGEGVALRVVDGPRGAIAAQVLAWERAAGAAPEGEAAGSAPSDPGRKGPEAAGPAQRGPGQCDKPGCAGPDRGRAEDCDRTLRSVAPRSVVIR
ncbi:cold-shock protein [Paracoccus contaminans]|uniref:CSD domain-containing protein n=1 Tax=Paracoccus contaminans TaxID=1945662 RepID=A0A1W6CUH6_9RHOB|nr:hypothetical protein B0A89_01080 [Paracoccus contaminans]